MRRKFVSLVFLVFCWVISAVAIEIAQVGKVVAPHSNTNQEFLILISDNFWQVSEVQEAVGQWQEDLFRHVQVGSRVFAVTPCFKDNYYGTGGDLEASEQIRNFLSQQYWEKGIIGAVLIGDIAFIPMWYRPYIDGWLSEGPCEIFFADLDYDFSSRLKWEASWKYPDQGTWYFDFDVEDGFPSYDGKPEIWVSRIIPPVRGMLKKTEEGKWRWYDPGFEERIEMLLRFFEKDHEYWQQGNEYCDLAYFIEEEIDGCDDYWWPIFPETWVERRIWCSNCNSKEDYFNLPETKLIYFSAHGSSFGINMCPESPNPDDISLCSSPDIYYNSTPVDVVIADSCNTFKFSDGELSVGQAFIFGDSDVVSGIGLGVAGCVGKFDSRPYSSILPFGEIWKGATSWTGSWNGIEFVLMGDPFVWVAKRIFLGEHYYFEYNPFDSTCFACSAAIKPLTLKVEDDILSLNFQWPGSINPVDIYVGVDARNSMGYFFVWTSSGIICWDGNLSSLSPYKKEWVRGVYKELFSGSLEDLPSGNYDGWVLVVPAGIDMSTFSFESSRYLLYHWYWQK